MNMRYTLPCVLTLACLLSACQSKPEIVPSSGPRPAMSPDLVKFYQDPPKKYEILGTVTVSRDEGARWDDRGDATVGFDILKKKAADLGANGLLMKADKGEDYQLILAGYKGEYYQVPVSGTPPRGMARAIYVIEEK